MNKLFFMLPQLDPYVHSLSDLNYNTSLSLINSFTIDMYLIHLFVLSVCSRAGFLCTRRLPRSNRIMQTKAYVEKERKTLTPVTHACSVNPLIYPSIVVFAVYIVLFRQSLLAYPPAVKHPLLVFTSKMCSIWDLKWQMYRNPAALGPVTRFVHVSQPAGLHQTSSTKTTPAALGLVCTVRGNFQSSKSGDVLKRFIVFWFSKLHKILVNLKTLRGFSLCRHL